MRMIHSFKARRFIVAGVFFASLGFGTTVSAEALRYLLDLNSKAVTQLGTLAYHAQEDTNYVAAINNAGQVVGGYDLGVEGYQYGKAAFITGPNGIGLRVIDDLGTYLARANGINDAGQVVGTAYTTGHRDHAFITGPNGMGTRDLGTLGGSESESYGNGINNAGQVVGGSGTTGGSWHAFITGTNGMGMRDLGTLGGDRSEAFGINASGQVVGRADTAGGRSHAFITGANGMGMRDLGTLGGTNSVALGINEAGWVVGYSDTAEGTSHAFIADANGMDMRDLGTLGGTDSRAIGINEAGQVVGYSGMPQGAFHAFVTGPNGTNMMDLNLLFTRPLEIPLTQAIDINNVGQVIAVGISFIPEPEIYALFLAGLGLIGFAARQKKAENLIKRY